MKWLRRIFGRGAAAPRPSHPRINEDWRPGDLAEHIGEGGCWTNFKGQLCDGPDTGDLNIVTSVAAAKFHSGKIGWSLTFKAWGTVRYDSDSFRKITPRADEIERAEPAFVRLVKRARILQRLHELHGHDLVCWCPQTSRWCHADTYLAMAPEYAELERLAA